MPTFKPKIEVLPNFALDRYGSQNQWYVFWTENGRSKRKSTRTDNRALAKKRQAAFVADYVSKQSETSDDVPVATVLRQYQHERGTKTPSEKANAQAIKLFVEVYGEDTLVSELTPSRRSQEEVVVRGSESRPTPRSEGGRRW